MNKQEYRKNIERRISIVCQALSDGCNDCTDDDNCARHLFEIQDLTLNPTVLLPKYENEIFGLKPERSAE